VRAATPEGADYKKLYEEEKSQRLKEEQELIQVLRDQIEVRKKLIELQEDYEKTQDDLADENELVLVLEKLQELVTDNNKLQQQKESLSTSRSNATPAARSRADRMTNRKP